MCCKMRSWIQVHKYACTYTHMYIHHQTSVSCMLLDCVGSKGAYITFSGAVHMTIHPGDNSDEPYSRATIISTPVFDINLLIKG